MGASLSVNLETDDFVERTEKLEKYVLSKVSTIEKYLSRTAREAGKVIVHLRQTGSKGNGANVCKIVLQLPKGSLTAKEVTPHLFAAIDVAIANLRHQLTEPAPTPTNESLGTRMIRKFGNGKYPI
jgi:ribosomal subunit interface protein